MRSVLVLARTATAAALGLAVTLGAYGWLYLLQPRQPGPQIGEALPLDELPHRAGVSLPAFLVVWGAAAVLLGLLARAARAQRATAALLLALGVGLFGYLAAGVSIAVVRQIPTSDAFAAASQLETVYVPAVLAGLGGALFGLRREHRRPRAPGVLAWTVAAAGALDLLYAMLPGTHTLLVYAPDAVRHVAAALDAPIGIALLVTARGLARRKSRALWVAVCLLAGSEALHLLHGWNRGAIGTGLLLAVLVAYRREFDAGGDPEARPRVTLRLLGSLAAIYAYGYAALWINRVEADRPFTLGVSLRETTDALVGLSVRGSQHLSGGVSSWFPISVLVLAALALGWTLVGWLAPWRYRLRQEAAEHELARLLVRAWGADTLAPFVLRADKTYFFGADERAFLAYRVVGGVAIVSGDPIGPPDSFDELVARFIAFAHARDWRIAILGASEPRLELYRRHGLQALYHGDEAVVDTASFSLEGRAIRKVRQSSHRLERLGYHVEILHPREIPARLRGELEEVARAWRGDEPERGFVMALDALFRLDDEDAVFVIGFEPDDTPVGFLHFAVTPAASALSLSSMPRVRTTPNGFNEWLVCAAIEWARGHGFERVSLNFAPFAALLAPEAELSRLQKVERRALLSLKGHFQLDNLLAFNRKFFPLWERRFVVYERRLDLPRVGIAALAAEAYLPFSGKERR